MSENLKRHRPDIKVLGEGKAIAFMPEDPMGVWCHIQEVRDLLDVKDKKIAELKEQYRDMDVTHTVQISKMNALIEELEESQRWRKFSEEKPEKREVVFVRMSDGFYRIAMYLARGLGWDIGDGAHHKSEEVTHWMPLPKTLEEDK